MNLKNFVLGIGIIIVFALALWQGIETFYHFPQWDEYCNEDLGLRQIGDEINQTSCETNGGKWTPQERQCITAPCPQGYCDFYSKCQNEYDLARDKHSKNVFYISIIIGIIAIIVGYTILSIEPIGSSLMASGIWAFFYGTVVNWRNFTEIWRFLLLLVTLTLLIWIAYRINTKRPKKKKR